MAEKCEICFQLAIAEVGDHLPIDERACHQIFRLNTQVASMQSGSLKLNFSVKSEIRSQAKLWFKEYGTYRPIKKTKNESST
jgi:hypothetical protein